MHHWSALVELQWRTWRMPDHQDDRQEVWASEEAKEEQVTKQKQQRQLNEAEEDRGNFIPHYKAAEEWWTHCRRHNGDSRTIPARWRWVSLKAFSWVPVIFSANTMTKHKMLRSWTLESSELKANERSESCFCALEHTVLRRLGFFCAVELIARHSNRRQTMDKSGPQKDQLFDSAKDWCIAKKFHTSHPGGVYKLRSFYSI